MGHVSYCASVQAASRKNTHVVELTSAVTLHLDLQGRESLIIVVAAHDPALALQVFLLVAGFQLRRQPHVRCLRRIPLAQVHVEHDDEDRHEGQVPAEL